MIAGVQNLIYRQFQRPAVLVFLNCKLNLPANSVCFLAKGLARQLSLNSLPDHLHEHFIYISLSGVKGKSLNRFPVALKTALAMAAETPVIPISPAPLTPVEEICGSGFPIK